MRKDYLQQTRSCILAKQISNGVLHSSSGCKSIKVDPIQARPNGNIQFSFQDPIYNTILALLLIHSQSCLESDALVHSHVSPKRN